MFGIGDMMNYKKLDNLAKYVNKMIESGAQIVLAEKIGKIAARPGTAGEKVVSWSVDREGNPLLEKTAVVTLDDTGIPGWVVTKIDDNCDVVIDQNGHSNQWIIEASIFRRKYEETDSPGIYKPLGGIQKFLKLVEAISIVQWQKEMSVDCGGYVNITNPEDMYVISCRDFEETYRVLEE